MVIESCPVTFIQSKSYQIIGMHGFMRTNYGTVVNTAFKKLQILP